MSEWLNNQKKHSSNFRKLLQERIEKANLRRQLTAEKAKRLSGTFQSTIYCHSSNTYSLHH